MTCEVDVNTSISGNVISIASQPVGDPIVLAGILTANSVGTQLPNVPVSSGVTFSKLNADNLTIGGLGGNLASYSSSTNYNGLRIEDRLPPVVIPVTNLNQLSAVNDVSGRSFTYFAVHISG